MKIWLLCLFLIAVPSLALAQNFNQVNYVSGAVIPEGNIFGHPRGDLAVDGTWHMELINVPQGSTGVTVMVNQSQFPLNVQYSLWMYAYDADGRLVQTLGEITQAVTGFHGLLRNQWNSIRMQFPSGSTPSTVKFYARGPVQLTADLSVLSLTN